MRTPAQPRGRPKWQLAALCICAVLGGSYGAFKIIERNQLARFYLLTPSMNIGHIYKYCGKPDRTWGSGFTRFEYDIIGGETVTIHFTGRLESVIYKSEDLLTANRR